MPHEIAPTLQAALEKPCLAIAHSSLKRAYEDMREAVRRSFPALWPQLHAYLAATASLCFSDFPLPVTMIAMGPSGSGKTEPLTWIMRSGLVGIVRCDSFTPKSFVSHASNVKREQLEKIDLLPKLRDACLCTKELAPLFSGREDDIRVAFAQLTSVLDGEGLVTSSGTQGTRGYSEPVNFVWLGATTPPRPKVFGLMAALGTRLFFISTDSKRPGARDYAALIRSTKKPSVNREECADKVRVFLETLFENIPRRSLSIHEIEVSEEIASSIGLYCEALTLLRGGLSLSDGNTTDDDRHGAPAIEHGWRAAQVLQALIAGSALIRGASAAELEDLQFVGRVCLSSMPEYRRLAFEAMLEAGGQATASDVVRLKGMAKKTALHHLKELAVLSVLDAETDGEPYRFRLKKDFHPLLTHTRANGVTPPSEHNRISGNTLTAQHDLLAGVTQNARVCEASPSWDGEAVKRHKETFSRTSPPPSSPPALPRQGNEDERYVPEPDLPEGF